MFRAQVKLGKLLNVIERYEEKFSKIDNELFEHDSAEYFFHLQKVTMGNLKIKAIRCMRFTKCASKNCVEKPFDSQIHQA